MKNVILVWVAALLALASADIQAAPPTLKRKMAPEAEPEILGDVKFSEVQEGMRVRVHPATGKPMIGTVSKVDDKSMTIDLSAEKTGFSGKFTFHKADVARIERVKPMTSEETAETLRDREKKNAELREAARIRVQKLKEKDREEKDGKKVVAEAKEVLLDSEREQACRRLLAEFPPEEGWGPDKLREIRERWILEDLPPSAKEGKFVTIFEQWRAAKETIDAIDARRKEDLGQALLERFPPGGEWNAERLKQILEKKARGEEITDLEDHFLQHYEDWLRAQKRPPQTGEPPVDEQAVEPPVETLPQEDDRDG